MALILGSKSPRRKEILSQVTTDFIVKVSDADENIGGQIDPFYLPVELAKIKAEAIECQKDDIVIGCDTVVILNDKILGKPKTLEESTEMLKDLSGTCHYVVSGLAIKRGERLYLTSETTLVKMRPLSEKEINTYVSRFKPLDKAGAYGIQEMAGAFVEKIDGDFYNVVGLPLCKLVKVLRDEFDLDLI